MAEEAASASIPVVEEIIKDAAEEVLAQSSSSFPLLATLSVIIGFIVIAIYFIKSSPKVQKVIATKTGKDTATKKKGVNKQVVLDAKADATHLINALRPNSEPLEILYAIATSPDTVAITSKHVELAEELRTKKRDHLAKEASNKDTHKSMDDLFGDDDGWAEDDEDDPAAAAAKKAREEKKKEEARLAKATGKDVTDFTKVKLEGVDDGVLGQEWVVTNLTKMGSWPPPKFNESSLSSRKFSIDGKVVGPLDHPGVKRALVMTMGRLNAKQLNTHPELTTAGPKGLIDPTYFQATMEYRQRVGKVLEGALRMAVTLRSYKLAQSIIDASIMFKIGLMDIQDEETREWFNNLMMKQYGKEGMPKLLISETFLGVPTPEPTKTTDDETTKKSAAEKKEEEKNRLVKLISQTKQVTTTDDKMALEMAITRQHAERFTKEKLAQAKKQGIPPQIALQAYREGWFILIRVRKIDEEDGSLITSWNGELGDDSGKFVPKKQFMKFLKDGGNNLYGLMDSSTIAAFKADHDDDETNDDNRLLIGWPFVITNVAQKAAKVKIHVAPPTEPGRYQFTVTIKSQEFIGVDEEFDLIVDVAKGEEKVQEATEEDNGEDKKDK